MRLRGWWRDLRELVWIITVCVLFGVVMAVLIVTVVLMLAGLPLWH